MSIDDLVEVLDRVLAGTPAKKCSVDYLVRLVLQGNVVDVPRTVGEQEVRAAIVVACQQGFMEVSHGGLASTDGSPWLVSTLVASSRSPDRWVPHG